MSKKVPCMTCSATGWLMNADGELVECEACEATGWVGDEPVDDDEESDDD